MTASPRCGPPLRVALYGNRAHQIQRALVHHPLAKLVAIAGFPAEQLPPSLTHDPAIRRHASLDALAEDRAVDLVSVSSPRCVDQANDVIRLLERGKHVYAEKPAAMTEADLDRVVSAAAAHGVVFREMAGTAFSQPYLGLREVVTGGQLGQVVQVLAQKSYPLHAKRPQDEDDDGGLLLQVGVHAIRMIEHVTGLRVTEVHALETQAGNVHDLAGGGQLRTACAMQMRLEHDAIATAIANYGNPAGFGGHGNEMLRVFGTQGMAEITDGGRRTRWIVGDEDRGALPTHAEAPAYHDRLFRHLCHGEPMPLTSQEELHPLRVVLRARKQRGLPG